MMETSRVTLYGMSVDLPSYNLGKIFTFAEIVAAGVKRLALSPPLRPDEMAAVIKGAEGIAAEWGVSIYREEDLLTTDLFDEALTLGKEVLLIYRDPMVKEEYLKLKKDKARLLETGRYRGKERKEINMKMGLLLSYDQAYIENILNKDPLFVE